MSAACLSVFQPSVSVTAAWNWSTKRNSQIKQSLIAPGAQPACQSQSDSKRGEIWKPTGDSYGAVLFFASLFWKSAEILFNPMGLKTYGMLLRASSVHSTNTWVLENNQPFLWHGDDGMQRQQRNLGNFPHISRNVLPIGLRQTTKGSVQILILPGFNHAVWCGLIWGNQPFIINQLSETCGLVVERALTHLNVKRKPEFQIDWIRLIFWYELPNECEIEQAAWRII